MWSYASGRAAHGSGFAGPWRDEKPRRGVSITLFVEWVITGTLEEGFYFDAIVLELFQFVDGGLVNLGSLDILELFTNGIFGRLGTNKYFDAKYQEAVHGNEGNDKYER